MSSNLGFKIVSSKKRYKELAEFQEALTQFRATVQQRINIGLAAGMNLETIKAILRDEFDELLQEWKPDNPNETD